MKKEIVIGAVAPDIDFLLDFIGLFPKYGLGVFVPVLLGEVKWHGSFTHSFLIAPLLALALMLLFRSKEYSLFLGGVLVHLGLDGLSYGNMLLWPVVAGYINLNIIPAHSIVYPVATGAVAFYLYNKGNHYSSRKRARALKSGRRKNAIK